MSRILIVAFILTGFMLAVPAFPVSAEDAAEDAAEYTFLGVKNCKKCHKKASTGDQFGLWSKGPHAKAFERLASEESIAKATELGLGNPQEAAECLKCHATAFAVMDDLANQKITLEEGVSCEGCHGPGSGYKSKKTMAAITAGEVDGASVGLLAVNEETCVGCHNPDNPFHEEFEFKTFLEKIAHPIPAAEPADDATGGE